MCMSVCDCTPTSYNRDISVHELTCMRTALLDLPKKPPKPARKPHRK